MSELSKLIAIVLFLVATSVQEAAAADIQVRPGDTLSLTIIGMPDLASEGVVGNDGVFSSGLLPPVGAAWRSIDEILADLQDLASSLNIRRRTAGGGIELIGLPADQTRLSIVGRRPVAAIGSVQNPGSFPFLPGTTVRMLLGMAGGSYRASASDSAGLEQIQVARLNNELEALVYEHARALARLWRVSADRADDPELPRPSPAVTYIDPDAFSELLVEQADALTLARQEFASEKKALRTALADTDEQIGLLVEQLEQQRAALIVTQNEFDRLEDIGRRGMALTSDISDAHRNALLASAQLLNVAARLKETRLERNALDRRTAELRAKREAELLVELDEVRRSLHVAGRQIKTLVATLGDLGSLKTLPESYAVPSIAPTIFRSGPEGERPIEAALDMLLEPGDVVDFRMVAGRADAN